jgi:hypothetical protein
MIDASLILFTLWLFIGLMPRPANKNKAYERLPEQAYKRQGSVLSRARPKMT